MIPPTQRRTPLILPFLGPFYDWIARPLAYVALRVVVGGMLVIEGWPKITAPFAMAGFTEGIGLYPGWLWSAALAVLQFAGGLMILAGFLTRPVALASAVMLAVTLWFHVTHPYGAAILSPEGVTALGGNAALFTADGLRNLGADGGAGFLHQVQFKAEGFSALWTVAALLLAAFGAGPLSVDRTLLKREF
ncbi:DoxX family protein [Paracoccus luteus]|uniref:DoxX family protein n=1 Tax=Paracoccus luteus TaxID=2508543 RepID=UPI00106FA9C0|nr:DoxX family protein [Paracoccus luteus]